MATTFRQLCNYVLTTLREDNIDGAATSLSTDYHKLIGTFANQIKEEIEDAHLWRDLHTTLTATINAGASTGSITGANERTRLLYFRDDVGVPRAIVFDVTIAASPVQLFEEDAATVEYNLALDPITASDTPAMFYVSADGAGGLKVTVYPKTVTSRTISLRMYVPQARLTVNDLDTVIKIPPRPLEMGTVWYALEERGEELGVNSLFTEERFRKALDDAIARDAEAQDLYTLALV